MSSCGSESPSPRHSLRVSRVSPDPLSSAASSPALSLRHVLPAVFRIRIRIYVFFGLPDPDPLVRGTDPDPPLDPDPDPSIIMQKKK
jgi:hypothetical protein